MADLDVVYPKGCENSLNPERIERPLDDDEADKKSLKRDDKKRKKEQKSSKKRKAQDRDAREIPSVDGENGSRKVSQIPSKTRTPDEPAVIDETRNMPISIDIAKKIAQVSKVDFFAALSASESQKPAVGTVHNTAKKVEKDKKDPNWTCPKCSTSNQNNSHQCHKCKAIKRMTEYR